MKKILIVILLFWLSFTIILTMGLYRELDNKQNNDHIIVINRLIHQITSDYDKGVDVEDLNYISKKILSEEIIVDFKLVNVDNETSFKNLNTVTSYPNPYLYKIIPGSHYVMMFEIKVVSHREVLLLNKYKYLLTSSLLLITSFFIVLYYYVILPMKKVSQIPLDLARGRLSTNVKQRHLGFFKEFFWGLDLLREVLNEEKQRNVELEKERKTLVAGLSHDVKTPLAAIKNYTLAIQDGLYASPETKEKALGIILEKVNIIEVLNNELLENSKTAFSNIRIVPEIGYLTDIIDNISTFIHQRIELKGIRFDLDNQCKDMQIWIDENKLIEVVSNIIENSIKYGDHECIKLDVNLDIDHVIMRFYNTGKGVNEKELKFIFSSFYRGSNVDYNKGHGLGLYISKKIMQGMDGDIYAENVESGFVINLVIKIGKD